MRDPKRIDRILKKLKTIWMKYPDLRLFQLLGNCFPAQDNYYVEDEELENRLKAVYREELDE